MHTRQMWWLVPKASTRCAKGEFPPVNAFWSLTMYNLPEQLLVKNPINRYLINSPMLPNLKVDADGGLTIYIQTDSPGKDKEANWLPAPRKVRSCSRCDIISPSPPCSTGNGNRPACTP